MCPRAAGIALLVSWQCAFAPKSPHAAYLLPSGYGLIYSPSPHPPRDVTDVFEAFHRDPRQRRKLEAFRVGTLVGYTPSPLVEDFRALKQEIMDEGLFEVREAVRV